MCIKESFKFPLGITVSRAKYSYTHQNIKIVLLFSPSKCVSTNKVTHARRHRAAQLLATHLVTLLATGHHGPPLRTTGAPHASALRDTKERNATLCALGLRENGEGA